MEPNLRRMTGDTGANPVVETIPPLTRTEKVTDIWAYIVGGSVGVMLSLAVLRVCTAKVHGGQAACKAGGSRSDACVKRPVLRWPAF